MEQHIGVIPPPQEWEKHNNPTKTVENKKVPPTIKQVGEDINKIINFAQLLINSKETYTWDSFILVRTSDGEVKIVFPEVEWENSFVLLNSNEWERSNLSHIALYIEESPDLYLWQKVKEIPRLKEFFERIYKADWNIEWLEKFLVSLEMAEEQERKLKQIYTITNTLVAKKIRITFHQVPWNNSLELQLPSNIKISDIDFYLMRFPNLLFNKIPWLKEFFERIYETDWISPEVKDFLSKIIKQ